MIRIATITQIQYSGRPLVQFQDPTVENPESGILILPTGDNAFPSIGDACYVLRIGGEYGLNYVFSYDIENSPLILEGEKIIYGKKQNQIYLKQDGSISITTADEKQIDITAEGGINIVGNVSIAGNVIIDGNLNVSGTSDLEGTTTIETKPFITHTHSGVTVGAGNTGGVV